MKKLIALLLAMVMVFGLVACGNNASNAPETTAPAGNDTVVENNEPAPATGAEIVLVTNGPQSTVDDRGFNQLSWEGIQAYAQETGKTANYYLPVETSTASYIQCVETAIKEGAKVIVCPGFLMSGCVYECQKNYPDVKFILIDATPASEETGEVLVAENTLAMTFAEDQSGFLAGYAAVYEGYTKLGFFGGMAVPAVVRFGYGYVQGIEYAAKELDIEVELLYSYTGTFDIAPEYQTKAASWYQTGTECIFGCGGADNVLAACESVGGDKASIGVDTDMSGNSETVITSAMKNMAPVITGALHQIDDGTFPGGSAKVYTIMDDACALPMATSRFKNFTQEQYDAIVADMKADTNGILSNMIVDVDADGNSVAIEDVIATLTHVTVKVVE